MFLSIYHNQSGEEYMRRLGPNESLDLREHIRKWAALNYDATPSFSEPGSYIFDGCAEWQGEIRCTKRDTTSCWTSEPFYLNHGEDSE